MFSAAGQIKIDAGHDESAVSEATVSSPTVKTLPVTGVSDNKDGACSKVYDTFNSKVFISKVILLRLAQCQVNFD